MELTEAIMFIAPLDPNEKLHRHILWCQKRKIAMFVGDTEIKQAEDFTGIVLEHYNRFKAVNSPVSINTIRSYKYGNTSAPLVKTMYRISKFLKLHIEYRRCDG